MAECYKNRRRVEECRMKLDNLLNNAGLFGTKGVGRRWTVHFHLLVVGSNSHHKVLYVSLTNFDL